MLEKKDWTGYEDALAIKESINDNTKQVIIRGITYKRKDIPLSYINHFAKKDITKSFKRWIDKAFYFNQFRTQSKINKKIANKKEIELQNKRLEWQTSRIEYHESIECKARKEKAKLKRRVNDMQRYYNNPIKYSLKRLLLHSIKASLDNKPYNNSHDIINYKDCLKSLSINAKSLGMSIKKLKNLNYHIDHIIPVSAYNPKNKKDLQRCFSHYNLRWLPSKENISKHSKIRYEDIKIIKTLPKKIYPKSWNGIIPKE
jgi:hypothetical protein